jgi:predicted phosphodiesterase
MRVGIMGDTHKVRDEVIIRICEDFKRRKVDVKLHTGDIDIQQALRGVYGEGPVYFAISKDQLPFFKDENLLSKKLGWDCTYPKDRIIKVGDHYLYLGHAKTSDHANKVSQLAVIEEYVGDVWLYGHAEASVVGHTHFSKYLVRGPKRLINPGTAEGGYGAAGGYEYAIWDMETGRITFARILDQVPTKKPLVLGIISNTLDISKMDRTYWLRLSKTFKEEGVTDVVHCGNIAQEDIGKHLEGFNVHYFLGPDDEDVLSPPQNWQLIDRQRNTFDVDGYYFYIDPDLGHKMLTQNEEEIYNTSAEVLKLHPKIHVIFGASSVSPLMMEKAEALLLVPGDARRWAPYAIVKLPEYEITFDHLERNPLPPLELSRDEGGRPSER